MLQYYEELRPTVEELAEWNARSANWEVSPGAIRECIAAFVLVFASDADLCVRADDWMPPSESYCGVDESALAPFGGAGGAQPSGDGNPADFEYRAPGAFA